MALRRLRTASARDDGSVTVEAALGIASLVLVFGVAAAASGVSPPNSGSGSSAAPSGMMIAYLVPVTSVMGPGVLPAADGRVARSGVPFGPF